MTTPGKHGAHQAPEQDATGEDEAKPDAQPAAELASRAPPAAPRRRRQNASVVPTLISVIAVAISALSLLEVRHYDHQQIAATAAAAAAARQADARKVSFYTPPGDVNALVVVNLSQQPVHDAVLAAFLLTPATANSPVAPVIVLGEIPPCTKATYNLGQPQLLQAIRKGEPGAAKFIGPHAKPGPGRLWQPVNLWFTDGNGNSWLADETYGSPMLISAPPPDLLPGVPGAPLIHQTSVAGCS